MVCGFFIAEVLWPEFQRVQAGAAEPPVHKICFMQYQPRRPAAIAVSFAAFFSSARLAAAMFAGARQRWGL